MPVDLAKVNKDKESMVSFIQTKGPSLPVHIAKSTNLNALFTAAFLSELYAEGKIKMSHLKIGSSSLYFIPGQEAQLEKFIDYLNPKEKEAFHLLKDKKILQDSEQVPAIRVALNAIKDFAIPIRINKDGQQIEYWKHFLISDKEIQELLSTQTEKTVELPKQIQSPKEEPQEEKPEQTQQIKIKKDKRTQKETSSKEFITQIKSFFEQKDLEIINILLEKKKEMWAIGRANTIFGKQEYYIIAKDKKKITEEEIDSALERSQSEKMPVILLAPGELDKKAAMKILSLRNIIKFLNPQNHLQESFK